MDLRQFNPSAEQIEEAARLLRYQPFVLDTNRHTGVAPSWLFTADPAAATHDDLFYDRRVLSADVWERASEANRRLAATYDGFVDRIVSLCGAGGSYLDVGCNTGYFPVKASLSGLGYAAGIDLGDYSKAVALLNEITGTDAHFSRGHYDPLSRRFCIDHPFRIEKFDVISASAVLCHLPDPLQFLAAMARLATKGLFIWNTILETDELLIHYNPPNRFTDGEFPYGFDEGTSISRGLLKLSMDKLGFPKHEEIEFQPDWMPEYWTRPACLHAFIFWK